MNLTPISYLFILAQHKKRIYEMDKILIVGYNSEEYIKKKRESKRKRKGFFSTNTRTFRILCRMFLFLENKRELKEKERAGE